MTLIKKQLGLAKADKQAEYDEIRISTQEYQEYKAEYKRQEQENDRLL